MQLRTYIFRTCLFCYKKSQTHSTNHTYRAQDTTTHSKHQAIVIIEMQGNTTKQTQFTPTLSTPATLHTKKAVPPNWTVVLCAIIC